MRTLIGLLVIMLLAEVAMAQTHTPNYCRNPDGSTMGWSFTPNRPELNPPVRVLQPLISGVPGTLCLGMGYCTASTLELTQPAVLVAGNQIRVDAELARVDYLSPGDCGSAAYLAVPIQPLSQGEYDVEYRFEFTYINALSIQVTETVEFTGSIQVGAAPIPLPSSSLWGLLLLVAGVGLFGVWQQRRIA